MKYLIDGYEITIDGLEVLFYRKEWAESHEIIIEWKDFERLLTASCMYEDIYDQYYTIYENEDFFQPELDSEKINDNLHEYDVQQIVNWFMNEAEQKVRDNSWLQTDSPVPAKVIEYYRELTLSSFLESFMSEFKDN